MEAGEGVQNGVKAGVKVWPGGVGAVRDDVREQYGSWEKCGGSVLPVFSRGFLHCRG